LLPSDADDAANLIGEWKRKKVLAITSKHVHSKATEIAKKKPISSLKKRKM